MKQCQFTLTTYYYYLNKVTTHFIIHKLLDIFCHYVLALKPKEYTAAGDIAGGVIGAVVFAALVAGGVFLVLRYTF